MGQIPFITLALTLVTVLMVSSHPLQDVSKKMEIPAMARKAGGSWKPELIQKGDSEASSVPDIVGDDHWEDSESSEECPPRHFFHIRGKQCVPYNCFKLKRDPKTGTCIEEEKTPIYRQYYGGYGHARSFPSISSAGHYLSNRHAAVPRLGGFRAGKKG